MNIHEKNLKLYNIALSDGGLQDFREELTEELQVIEEQVVEINKSRLELVGSHLSDFSEYFESIQNSFATLRENSSNFGLEPFIDYIEKIELVVGEKGEIEKDQFTDFLFHSIDSLRFGMMHLEDLDELIEFFGKENSAIDKKSAQLIGAFKKLKVVEKKSKETKENLSISPKETNQEKFHVTIIEDDESVLDLFSGFLEDNGLIESSTFENPIEALHFIQNNKTDLVFTDYHMPEMNGMELAKRIRTFNQTLPIIMTSAYSGNILIKDFVAAGISVIVEKPFVFGDVQRIVIEKIEEQRLLSFAKYLGSSGRILVTTNPSTAKTKSSIISC